MRWLLFLSRQALIFGIFVLMAILIRMNVIMKKESIFSNIVSVGYFIGLILIPFVNLCYLAVFVIKRKLKIFVPGWLITLNVLFLCALLFYIFYLDDPYYH
jgi:hypothetical protein